MQNGVFYGNGNILGYDRVGKEMVINPEQAKTVRMIYDMYLSGMGVTTIQYELEKAGRLTALGKERWFASYISKMLRNSFYCGIITYHKEYTPDFLKQKKIKNYGDLEYVQVQGTHEPIVTVEEYEQVQKLMDIDKEMFRSKKQEIEDRVAKLTEEIKGLQPEKEQTSNEDYSVKLLELRERLKEYTGFDYSVIPESIVEAFIEHIWVSKDEFRWYLRTGNNAGGEFDPDDHIKIGAFTLTIDDAKKYIYSFSTRRRVYKWADLNVSVWV